MKVCATKGCGKKVPDQQGRSRPRKFCLECRPPRDRTNPRTISLPKSDAPESAALPGLVDTYRRQLEQAERLDTPDGAHVLLLARMLEQGEGTTASGAAALSKELRAAMAVALKDAPGQADELDELAARRRQKAAGA